MAGYGSTVGFAAWATAAGHVVPDGDVSAALQRGSDYIDAVYGSRFVGTPTDGVDQERSWPRTGATAHGISLDSALVPAKVVNASYIAALAELRTPGVLTVTVNPTQRVKRQKVEGIEREFFEPGDLSQLSAPIISLVDGLLWPFLVPVVNSPVGLWSLG